MVNNKLEPSDLENEIKSYTFTILPSGKTTVCELTLKNGFCVVGSAGCLDINNFDKEIGEKAALKDAKRKAIDFIAYSKQWEITVSKMSCEEKCGPKKASECKQIEIANRAISQTIKEASNKYNIFSSSIVNPMFESLSELVESTNKGFYTNIVNILSNLTENEMEFNPDLILSNKDYMQIGMDRLLNDTDATRDIINFAEFFNEMSSDNQRDFVMLQRSIKRGMLYNMYDN